MNPATFSNPQPNDMPDESPMASRWSITNRKKTGQDALSSEKSSRTNATNWKSELPEHQTAVLEPTRRSSTTDERDPEDDSHPTSKAGTLTSTRKKHDYPEHQPVVEACKRRDDGSAENKTGSSSTILNASTFDMKDPSPSEARPPNSAHQPGAFRVGTLDSGQPTIVTEDSPLQIETVERAVQVEARVVEDHDPTEAPPYAVIAENDPLQQNYETLKLQHERARKCTLFGLLLLIVVVGIITGTVVGTTNNDEDQPSSPSASPSYPVLDKVWNDLGFPEAPDPTSQNLMGTSPSFSSDGNIVAVGLPGAHTFSGSVRVYRLSVNDGSWNQLGQEIIGGLFDVAGWSLQLSRDGKTLVVASISYVFESFEPGYVQVYRFADGDNAWIPVGSNVVGDDTGDGFGRDVAISSDGNVIAVGAFQGGTDGAGYAKVYRFVANTTSADDEHDGQWKQLGATIRGSQYGDNLGNSVALSANGKILAVGAHQFLANAGLTGYVRVLALEEDQDTWTMLSNEDVSGEAPSGEFGWDIDLSDDGTVLLVGAISSADRQQPGQAQVFEWQAQDNMWLQRGQKLIGDDAGDQFGYSLSMSGDGSMVAVAGWDRAGFRMGYVRVFRYFENEMKWIRVGDRIQQDPQETTFIDEFGIAVGLSEDGTTLAVTSPFHDLPNGGLIDVGRLEVFRLED